MPSPRFRFSSPWNQARNLLAVTRRWQPWCLDCCQHYKLVLTSSQFHCHHLNPPLEEKQSQSAKQKSRDFLLEDQPVESIPPPLSQYNLHTLREGNFKLQGKRIIYQTDLTPRKLSSKFKTCWLCHDQKCRI